jgi:glycosyltransferase involved in cell wall biosynthesis
VPPICSASVLVNLYNYRRFVEQTHPPLEVIVVDDGSTDGGPEFVEAKFCSLDARVRLIRQANAGQLSAMQTGVAAARGEVLFFLDADDTWERGYLQSVLQQLETTARLDYIFSGHRRSDGLPSQVLGEKRNRVLGRRSALAYVTGKYPVSMTSTLAIRTALARRFLPVPAAILGDWKTDADQVLAMGAALAGGCGAFLAGSLVHYRLHGANHFAGRAGFDEPAARAARQTRAARARLALAEKLGLDAATADRIAEEFPTIERPRWRECRRACKAAAASPRGVLKRAVLMAGVLWQFFSRG